MRDDIIETSLYNEGLSNLYYYGGMILRNLKTLREEQNGKLSIMGKHIESETRICGLDRSGGVSMCESMHTFPCK